VTGCGFRRLVFCGGVSGCPSCVPFCVRRACGGVHAVIFGQCAVVGAVWDVVRACGACVFAFCVGVCVACRCALFLGDTRHYADVALWWVGLWRRVCLHARVCGVMAAASAAPVGMCVRWALGLRKCAVSWRYHTRDARCAS
jgi:hypothetical protein